MDFINANIAHPSRIDNFLVENRIAKHYVFINEHIC